MGDPCPGWRLAGMVRRLTFSFCLLVLYFSGFPRLLADLGGRWWPTVQYNNTGIVFKVLLVVSVCRRTDGVRTGEGIPWGSMFSAFASAWRAETSSGRLSEVRWPSCRFFIKNQLRCGRNCASSGIIWNRYYFHRYFTNYTSVPKVTLVTNGGIPLR